MKSTLQIMHALARFGYLEQTIKDGQIVWKARRRFKKLAKAFA